MFCPRCSQQQANEDIRYCSRCGLPLELVAQILAHGGSLPQSTEVYNKQKGWFTRSNGWKFGLAWLFILTFLLAPFLAILGADALPELSAALGVFGGLLIILFSFIFLKNPPQTGNADQFGQAQKATEYDALQGKTNQNVLPPQQAVPTSVYIPPVNNWKAPDTSDLAHPGSVTEGTTKLLERDE